MTSSIALALAGGALIGLSASLMLMLNGRIAGISGIVGDLLQPRPGEVGWRAWFLAGSLLGGAAVFALRPELFGTAPVPTAVAVPAGLLVGFGTRLGNGCTSGHGVCGVCRLSKRSIVATITFMLSEVVAAYAVQHVLLAGGAS